MRREKGSDGRINGMMRLEEGRETEGMGRKEEKNKLNDIRIDTVGHMTPWMQHTHWVHQVDSFPVVQLGKVLREWKRGNVSLVERY